MFGNAHNYKILIVSTTPGQSVLIQVFHIKKKIKKTANMNTLDTLMYMTKKYFRLSR